MIRSKFIVTGHYDDCMDAGGRATQEQLPRKYLKTLVLSADAAILS